MHSRGLQNLTTCEHRNLQIISLATFDNYTDGVGRKREKLES